MLNPIADTIYESQFIEQESAYFPLSKRLMDIAISLLLLPVLLPFLMIMMVLIRLDSPGFPVFTQMRGGESGQDFKIYKLRTLFYDPSDNGRQQVVKHDQRVTRMGRYLRRFHIDELPQLFNILKGDMSFVGPRPHSASMDAHYKALIPYYTYRFKIRPGITGLAQVNGSNGVIAILSDMEQRVLYDIAYIERQSLWLDCMIIFKTLLVVFHIK